MKNKTYINYFLLVLGSFLSALAINLFLLPNNIVVGGVSGLATVIHSFVPIPVGTIMILFDIPLFVLAFILVGRSFGGKSVVSSILFAVFIDLTASFTVVTKDFILASVAGGAMLGFGIALLIKSGATSGGTDLAAGILVKYFTKYTISQMLFILDGAVIILAGIVFKNFEIMLYAIIAILVSTKIISMVTEGINYAKTVFVISDSAESIANAVINEMNHGLTTLYGRGYYSGDEKTILLCVIYANEFTKLKKIVNRYDEKAFLILSETKEVHGEGFKI